MKKLFTLLLSAILFACTPIDDPYNPGGTSGGITQPTAIFSVSKINPLTIELFNESKHADTFLWNFGDGTTSTDKNPIHKYKNKGVYRITLKAMKKGKTDEAEAIITIENPTRVYVTGYSYEKLSIENEYFMLKITDDDIFTTTWCTTEWKLVSSANMPFISKFSNPVLLDDMSSDKWYKVTILYSTNKKNGKELTSGKFYTEEFFKEYPEAYTWEDKDKKNKFSIYFDYR